MIQFQVYLSNGGPCSQLNRILDRQSKVNPSGHSVDATQPEERSDDTGIDNPSEGPEGNSGPSPSSHSPSNLKRSADSSDESERPVKIVATNLDDDVLAGYGDIKVRF
jgi:hypothetical protein